MRAGQSYFYSAKNVSALKSSKHIQIAERETTTLGGSSGWNESEERTAVVRTTTISCSHYDVSIGAEIHHATSRDS
ncbi:hypothetical protein WR25_16480 [Diploscapter pachys]|uniref:Uncharacterized protein n=1 Tax=Diploscapter pachys TaxID=2018661 RepID=A0A2A2J8W4_9BILA|nr:hypothetical protein WR25_16480 [Diploscapter pachys]